MAGTTTPTTAGKKLLGQDEHWGELPLRTSDGKTLPSDVVVECGWGRLIFGHTFHDRQKLVDTLRHEREGRRDIALYLRDPHVALSLAPHELFLDPSHTYRLWLAQYPPAEASSTGFVIRRPTTHAALSDMNRVLASCGMVPFDEDLVWRERDSRTLTHLVAMTEDESVIGTVMGVDHVEAFDDPENGSSLWCLAVDPQTPLAGVGEALVRSLAEDYLSRGRGFIDLSVMHDNNQAIALYEKLGFIRVPVFCVKNKNAINEKLYSVPAAVPTLNPYAMIIIDEARKRGIAVDVLDQDLPLFRLSLGGRSIVCRESLTELTNAIAMTRCANKVLASATVARSGVRVPAQQRANSDQDNEEFLREHERIVVKPVGGEQGVGVTVDVRTPNDLCAAIERAAQGGDEVLLEAYVEGEDLRLIVIDHRMVAAAVRRPPSVVGNGQHTIRQLIQKLSRRRRAATGGESRIPIDSETRRVVDTQGFDLDTVLSAGQAIQVRKTANLHTGGTIHDVTDVVHRSLCEAAINASLALDIPVTGIDFIVPDVSGPDYVFIEANERPGLANHEPQPTAERFVDLLFPQTAARVTNRQPLKHLTPAARGA